MMIPDSIQDATRERAERYTEYRRMSLQFALEGPAIRRNPDREKRLEWLMRNLEVDRNTAELVDAGGDPARAGLSAERECQVRPFQNTDDLHHIMFLARASSAASSVGRFVPAGAQGSGTFFMISRDLLMTNHHVIGTRERAKELFAEFNYELDEAAKEREPTHFALAPQDFFHTDPGLDFTVIALGAHLDGTMQRDEFGIAPLVTEDPHFIDTFVNIIQHPNTERKQIVFRENRLVCHPADYLTYNADALTGSSGSPVFNDDWKVVGLHHSAVDLGEICLPCGLRVQDSVNEAIPVTRIVDALCALLKGGTLNQNERKLLAKALSVQ